MVSPTHVIWDWNGTLIDDVAFCYGIVEQMRKARQMPPLGHVDGYRSVFRFPVIEYYYDMGYTFETETYEDITREYLALYSAGAMQCPLRAGAVDILQRLESRGMQHLILSATGQARLVEEVKNKGIADRFCAILGQPNDAAANKAQRGLDYIRTQGIDPARTVLVGDTDHDFEVAEAIGCRCILLDAGHQVRSRLEPLRAEIIHELSELNDLL